MRTTVNLPEDVYELARSRAQNFRISLGEALADLVRQATLPAPKLVLDDPLFPYISYPEDAPRRTSEDVKALLRKMDDEEDLRKAFPFGRKPVDVASGREARASQPSSRVVSRKR